MKDLMPIVLLAGIGLAAFWLFKDNPLFKGATITLQNVGGAGSQAAHRWSEFDIKSRKKEAEVGEGIMHAGYELQQVPGKIGKAFGDLFDAGNKWYDADRARDYEQSLPVRKLLNPSSIKPKVTEKDDNDIIDELIDDALEGRGFRPYSGSAGRPYS